ncbi:MAG: glycosyltransferase family 4 protein [Eubacteriales bacterium]|nr:glycosyltransferase family 4 protein [Eubacteriales bacterium]
MKILLTSDWYTPAVNGVVTSVLNLKRGLEARGHEVRILTLSGSRRSFEQAGVIYVGSVKVDAVYPGARLRVTPGKNWISKIAAWSPDIVHSNCEFSTFRMARQIAVRLHIPLVHTYHTIYENYTHYFSPSKIWGRKLAAALSRRVATKTDALIAPTEKVRTLLQGYGISTPVCVLPTGIDQEKFMRVAERTDRMRIREQLHILPGQTVLVFIGRMAKEKNCDELIRMMVHFRGEDICLLLVGDGPCREGLQRQAKELDMQQQIVFAGMVQPDQVNRYYQAGDLFVSASTSETQGLTYIEALSSGLPMLCRKDASLEGIVMEDCNGWQYNSTMDFIQKTRSFLKHPEWHRELSQNAQMTGKEYSISAFARQAEQIYQEQIDVYHGVLREGSA